VDSSSNGKTVTAGDPSPEEAHEVGIKTMEIDVSMVRSNTTKDSDDEFEMIS
jgi:hypothetical protein